PNHPFYDQHKYCDMCGVFIPEMIKRAILNGKEVCVSCYDNVKIIPKESGIDLNELKKSIEVGHVQLNKPTHYHTHDIDTIEFLKAISVPLPKIPSTTICNLVCTSFICPLSPVPFLRGLPGYTGVFGATGTGVLNKACSALRLLIKPCETTFLPVSGSVILIQT